MHRQAVLLQREDFERFWREHRLRRLMGRNHIIASLCPQVYGLYVVKLAVALVMAGGVRVRHDVTVDLHLHTCTRYVPELFAV